MTLKEALELVLELAEQNSLSNAEVQAEPRLYDESVRQQEAIEAVRIHTEAQSEVS